MENVCFFHPKKNRDWSTFQKPFKDGDVVATTKGKYIGIVKIENGMQQYAYVAINEVNNLSRNISYGFSRLATEEEKQKIFKAIKENGYQWDPQTKTLEKLITLKFKIGDKIRAKGTNSYTKILGIKWDQTETYYETLLCKISVKDQDKFELVPNKFDITTLKPFDKVLTRVTTGDVWGNDFFGYYKDRWFHCSGHIATHYCIPYEENKHLLGTTNDCDDYYKTWEE